VKFYVSASVGVIIKVILQNARCNNKDNDIVVFDYIPFPVFTHTMWMTHFQKKNVESYSKNKFENLLFLVGFVIRIYHKAQSSEYQNNEQCSNVQFCVANKSVIQ